jgi:hypothetical protein
MPHFWPMLPEVGISFVLLRGLRGSRFFVLKRVQVLSSLKLPQIRKKTEDRSFLAPSMSSGGLPNEP